MIFFDCDSTLSRIEGVDEMARSRGPAVLAEIEAMTRRAMEGEISLDAVFGKRLDLVRPTREETAAIGALYVETVESAARAAVEQLRAEGWKTGILSGGYRQAIQPLAEFLGIGLIEAVDLFFNADGTYSGYDRDYPTTRNGGKPEVIRRWKHQHGGPVVMVGDGISDLETKGVADRFIGYGGFADRELVRDGADRFAMSLEEIPGLVRDLNEANEPA